MAYIDETGYHTDTAETLKWVADAILTRFFLRLIEKERERQERIAAIIADLQRSNCTSAEIYDSELGRISFRSVPTCQTTQAERPFWAPRTATPRPAATPS